nr:MULTISPECIES: LysR substrate-binding domain-containing protein [Ramlibacter]
MDSTPDGALKHGEPVRLSELPGLRRIVPGLANARAPVLEQYFAANGVAVAARRESDTMLGTLDLVARSDWRAVLLGVFDSCDVASGAFTLNPLANPPLLLDLTVIEPERQPLSTAASAFFGALRKVTDEVNLVATRMAEEGAPHQRRTYPASDQLIGGPEPPVLTMRAGSRFNSKTQETSTCRHPAPASSTRAATTCGPTTRCTSACSRCGPR